MAPRVFQSLSRFVCAAFIGAVGGCSGPPERPAPDAPPEPTRESELERLAREAESLRNVIKLDGVAAAVRVLAGRSGFELSPDVVARLDSVDLRFRLALEDLDPETRDNNLDVALGRVRRLVSAMVSEHLSDTADGRTSPGVLGMLDYEFALGEFCPGWWPFC